MKIIRNYLTSDEVIEIFNELIKQESAIARHIILYGMTAQCVCDLSDIKWENCNDLYDAILKEGIYEDFIDISNFVDVESLVDKEIGVDSTIRQFTKELSEKIDNMNVGELAQQLVQMKEEIK